MPTDSPLIGYGAFHLEMERYEEYGDWAIVADSPESLSVLLERDGLEPADYRTDELRLEDILAGRGDTVGLLCLEPEARKRFVQAADAAGVKYTVEELGDELVSVEIPNSSMNDITDVAAIKPLLDHLFEENPPAEEIELLAGAIRTDPVLAGQCLELFNAEVKLHDEAHGALLVWLGFSLALAGDGKAFERFTEILRAYDQDEAEEAILRGHYQTALGCLLLYEESARRTAGRIPFPDSELEKRYAIWDDLELLVSVCRSRDEELRRRVAAEAERLLAHPKLDDEYVGLVGKVLAAADPRRAATVIPEHIERCEEPKELERIVRVIGKAGSAEELLAPDWRRLADEAAGEQFADLDADDDFDDDDEDDEDLEDEDNEGAYERIDELVAGFVASFGNREAGSRPSFESTTALTHALHLLWNRRGTLPEDASPEDIEELMTELVPRKVVDDETGFRTLGLLLAGFYRYMTEKGFVENGEELLQTVERCTEPMVRNAADPAHWGLGKSVMGGMHGQGVDLDDPVAIDRWIREFNARPLEDRAGVIPDLGRLPIPSRLLEGGDEDEVGDDDDFGPPPEPRKPEPDPYAPCPCGSGKKYKWCCREKDRMGRG